MLPRLYRLKLRTKESFFKNSSRVQTPNVRWFVHKTDSQSATAAVVVPKSVEPLATRRNRIKRVLKAALLPLLQDKSGISLVGIVKKNSTQRQINHYEDVRQLHDLLYS